MPTGIITKLPISKLKLLENNPRKIDKDQFQKLTESLLRDPDFLSNRPVLVHDVDGVFIVYAGNQRVRAAKKLGWKEVPCIVESNLMPDTVERRTLLDNKTYGTFDFDILANSFDIDVMLESGFTADELVGAVQDIETVEEKEEKPETVKKCPHCDGIL